MVSLNTSNITVNDDGSVSFSGAVSGIDYQSIIDSAVAAKRITAASIEDTITQNTGKLNAYAELMTLSTDFTSVLDVLRGSTSFFTDNVFDLKSAYANSRATDTAAPDHVVSNAEDIISAAVSTNAAAGTHTITVQQVAENHQVRSGAITDKQTALTGLGMTEGSFELNGKTITISASDTLVDLRDTINASDAGVTATIVSASSTEHYLVLVADESGLANTIDFGTATDTSFDLGLTDANSGVAAVANQLQGAQDSILTVDGISGITRSDNEIDDIIDGVTLSLVQAEADTEISLTIETDLNSVKTALNDFVQAYNGLREFYDDQRTQYDRDETIDLDGDGDATNDDKYGSLAFDSTLRTVMDRMATVIASTNSTLSDGFQSLSQIGLKLNEDYMLEMDEDTLDNLLLTDVEEIAKLFEVGFTSSDSRVRYVSNEGATQQGTYYLNVAGTDADGAVTAASISSTPGASSADNGTVVADGRSLDITSASGAEGLSLLFMGGANLGEVSDIEITITRGIADQLYSYFDELTQAGGQMEELQTQMLERNESLEKQVSEIDKRLETYRTTLESKYIAMEGALAELESLKETIQNFVDAMSDN